MVVTKTLVTTADESTWPKDKNTPVLFLGEWCKLYSKKDSWEVLDYVVQPYHWDDRTKFKKDYYYLDGLYESVLLDLSNHLNRFHNVNYSLRYWRILLGPWLGVFIQIIFDRWSILNTAINSNTIKKCFVLDKDFHTLIPKTTQQFNSMILDDYWNEAIFSQLIDKCFQEAVPVIKIPHDKNVFNKKIQEKKYKLVKSWIIFLIGKTRSIFCKEEKYFIQSVYLPFSFLFRLLLKLGQIYVPCYTSTTELEFEKKINIKNRQWEHDHYQDEFYNIIYSMSLLHIPTLFLENYKDLNSSIPPDYPKNPGVIFTAISWYGDDVFMAWSAKKCEKGAKLVIAQHGGHFGMSDVSFYEKHQIDISDKWISWGWKDVNKKKIIPAFNFKSIGGVIKENTNGDGLLVSMTVPRYGGRMMDCTISGQWLGYFKDNCDFLNFLPKNIRTEINISPSVSNRHGWDDGKRFRHYFPENSIKNATIESKLKNSRICICTYNGTTMLEALSWNFPVIVFFNKEHWPLKQSVIPMFNLLKSVGIFHESPESAAKQLESIWDDISSWWYSNEVQSARNLFCNNFSNSARNPAQDLSHLLEDIYNEG
jgi:putative transferase (TIGR04331 family)